MKNYTIYLLGLVLFSFALACTKKGNQGPVGQPGPTVTSYKGVVCGHIAPYDTYGFRFNPKYLDVQVTLTGIGSVYTDSMGYFQFDSVPTGSYTLSAKGVGMGATEVRNVQMFKDTCYRLITMSEIPSYNVLSAEVRPSLATTADSVDVLFKFDNLVKSFLVFVSTSDDANAAAGNYAIAKLLTTPRGMGRTVPFYIPDSDYRQGGIAAGTPIYYTICSYVVNDNSKYINQATGKWVYTAIGTPIHLVSIAP